MITDERLTMYDLQGITEIIANKLEMKRLRSYGITLTMVLAFADIFKPPKNVQCIINSCDINARIPVYRITYFLGYQNMGGMVAKTPVESFYSKMHKYPGYTALMLAVLRKRFAIAIELMICGADPMIQGIDNKTSIFIASENNDLAILRILVT